jgi:hypothetical protein
MLKCRAFFGVNIRADVFACLVARGPATASGLARELGYSQRRVRETLMEMQLAGLFQTRFDGNRKEYSIESSKRGNRIASVNAFEFATKALEELLARVEEFSFREPKLETHRLESRRLTFSTTEDTEVHARRRRAEIVRYASDNLQLERDLQLHPACVQLLGPLQQAILAADHDLDG